MNKINGYALLEGLFSLGVLTLIALSVIPMVLQLFQNLNSKKEESERLQAIYDESERLLVHSSEETTYLRHLIVHSVKQEGGWKICAESKKKKSCMPL